MCPVLCVVAFQGGQAYLVFHRKDSYDENRCSCDDLYQRVAHVELHAEAVDQTSGHTRHGVNLFSEYEGYLIDEYIADDASCRSGHGAHDDGHPHGKSRIESLVYAHYGEKRQSYGVEIEKCVVEVYQILAEQYDP